MNFSPSERAQLLDKAAELLVAEIKATVDLSELITLPLDAVAQMIGRGPKQTSRLLPTRPMGSRKLGVSLKALQTYQAGQLEEPQTAKP